MKLSKVALASSIILALSACTGLEDVDHKWCPPEEVEHIDLKADALFKFNKSEVQDMLPVGVAQLDEVATRLNDMYETVENIHVTGHTDRLGSDSYNQVLSERRAQTVANYLQTKGVNATFTIEGKGETQPVHSCDENLTGQELRDCLQPNRRVELKVTGKKKTSFEKRLNKS
ncbi:MAG: OmpA family protein [[Pasteurella] aerogenes]|nr:OmpA family protein [[Pasteurella] aerogenes]